MESSYYYYYSNLELFLAILHKKRLPFIREIGQETFLIPRSETHFLLINKDDLIQLPSLTNNMNLLKELLKVFSDQSVIKESFFRILYDDYKNIKSWSNLNLYGVSVGIEETFILNKSFTEINCSDINLLSLDNYIFENLDKKDLLCLILKKIKDDDSLIIDSGHKTICQIYNNVPAFDIAIFDNKPTQLFWSKQADASWGTNYYIDYLKFVIGPHNKISKDELYKILIFYETFIENDIKHLQIIKLLYENMKFYEI